MNIELYEEIRGTNTLITFDPIDKIIYLRKKITNDNDPEDELGGYYVMKKLPRGKPFEKVTAGSAEIRFIKKKVEQHSDFALTDYKKFNLLLEEALDTVQMKYMDWLDQADERREFELQQAEQEAQLEMEMVASEGAAIIDEMQHPLICISWMIDWCTAGERLNILYAFLAYSSQIILKNPISVIGIGDGGSGKTHIQEVALSMIPEEFVMTIKSTTDAALFGFCDDDPNIFDGKIVNIGDMGGKNDHEEAQNFKNAMKEMQSDGHMSRIKRDPDVVNGGWINKEYSLYGKPCLTYTNVPGYDFEDQEKSRSIFFQPRTDNDEAVAVFKTLSRMKGTPTTRLLKEEQDKIQNIKKMLIALRHRMETVNIYNPYNEFMQKYLGSSRYFKRDVDKYDGILRVITAINGYKREIIDDTLFTTREDIMMFIDILERYRESITSNLSPGAADLLQELKDNAENWSLYDDMEEGSGVTVNDYMVMTKNTRAIKRTTGNYFAELNREGYVKAEKDGRVSRYYLLDTSVKDIKNEIMLSTLDKKILKFNYNYSEVMKVLDSPVSPVGVFSNPPVQPIWNDYLPENGD